MKLTIQFDGACLGNPGPMGLGIALLKGSRIIKTLAVPAGIGTNNIAEYSAVLRGLQEAKQIGASEVNVSGDSQLIIKQLSGEWRIRNPSLSTLYKRIKELEKQFEEVNYEWVPRELNKVADSLSKEAALQVKRNTFENTA